jgi:hypothetical protein
MPTSRKCRDSRYVKNLFKRIQRYRYGFKIKSRIQNRWFRRAQPPCDNPLRELDIPLPVLVEGSILIGGLEGLNPIYSGAA